MGAEIIAKAVDKMVMQKIIKDALAKRDIPSLYIEDKSYGTIIFIDSPIDFERENWKDYIDELMIDGTTYKVKGIEMWCVHTIREGMMIGVLV